MTGYTVLGVQEGLEAAYGISREACTDLIPLKGQLILLSY